MEFLHHVALQIVHILMSTNCNETSKAWILGKSYPSAKDESFRSHCEAFFRFTYRRDFPPFHPYTISSDSGWGCMLRASQMLMGYTLRRHMLGTGRCANKISSLHNPYINTLDWKVPKHRDELAKQSAEYRSLLSWFIDYPGYPHFYSLHHVIQCGMKYDKLPGEWFGPSTVSYILRDIATLHCTKYGGQVTVMVTQGETIYISEAERLCSNVALNDCLLGITENLQPTKLQQSQQKLFQRQQLRRTIPTTSSKSTTGNSDADTNQNDDQDDKSPLQQTSDFFDPLFHPPPSELHPWIYSLLVLMPLRLGIQSVNPEYIPELKAVLQNPHCVGILGGRVNHAIYFMGYQDNVLFGHDPHVVYTTPSREIFETHATSSAASAQLQDYLNQLHTPEIVTLDFAYLDPSLTIGFYFATREDFHAFCNATRQKVLLQQQQHTTQDYAPLYRVEQTAPSYLYEAQMEGMLGLDDEDDEEGLMQGGRGGTGRRSGEDDDFTEEEDIMKAHPGNNGKDNADGEEKDDEYVFL